MKVQYLQRHRGYSLLELAIVISIIGVSAFMFISLVAPGDPGGQINSGASTAGSTDRRLLAAESLASGQSQLMGFLRARNRLPCPDTTGDGQENCDATENTTGRPQQVGVLPYRSMGLAQPLMNSDQQAIVYAVYRRPHATAARDMDLAVLRNRKEPDLPDNTVTGISNAVDFCWAVRNAALASNSADYVHTHVENPLSQAFVLVDPGSADADASGSVTDGPNSPSHSSQAWGFERPAAQLTETYDDVVLSVGFGQLAARVGCPMILGAVSSAARAAVAADDVASLTDFFADFRAYALTVAEQDITMADVSLGFAVTGGLLTAVDSGVAIAQGINSGGTAAAAAAAGIAVSVALQVESLVSAGEGVGSAREARDDSASLRDSAVSARQQTRNYADTLLQTAIDTEREARLR
ncbi:type II secretion system protein [Pseudohongiella sp. SYSU M77423]|uniref:type II secretion system protein n=1 Tax=Pseudohongiella sp. SYSU M77423 TaxID=3042312 RepID=UPI0024818755|nr:type II secretion system protein [Pseudohongiella sp. SYSU M77423]MDH7942548.1 type II secretion system protein [Pseudohongiella sp. SYSU M77423]